VAEKTRVISGIRAGFFVAFVFPKLMAYSVL